MNTGSQWYASHVPSIIFCAQKNIQYTSREWFVQFEHSVELNENCDSQGLNERKKTIDCMNFEERLKENTMYMYTF